MKRRDFLKSTGVAARMSLCRIVCLFTLSLFSLLATLGIAQPTVETRQSDGADPFTTAYNYVVTFYPRWFTWIQPLNRFNRLIGPVRISPISKLPTPLPKNAFKALFFFSWQVSADFVA